MDNVFLLDINHIAEVPGYDRGEISDGRNGDMPGIVPFRQRDKPGFHVGFSEPKEAAPSSIRVGDKFFTCLSRATLSLAGAILISSKTGVPMNAS